MTIRIGNAPCSWGVEFADDARNPSWQSVLKDCADAGYTGIELGPVGYMPEDPAVLGDALGAVQKKSLEQVGELIKDKPEEALSVLRGWLSTPAKA